MIPLVRTILANQAVQDASGRTIPLHSHTSEAQGRFLQSFVERAHVSTALEIGLAYGISALFICESLSKKQNPKFISIDQLQSSWDNIGLTNLKRAGYDNFTEFHSGISLKVLPQLLEKGEQIDFAYVDTSKIFDVVLLDAVFITLMLRVGGFIAFDDVGQPGVRKVARYLAKWPHLKVVGLHAEWPVSLKRKVLRSVANKFPFRKRIFREDILLSDSGLGIDGNCVVFQKISEDDRVWNWSGVP